VDGSDAIIGVDTVTICGTDLHILKGDVPVVSHGRILGHKIDGTQAQYVRVPGRTLRGAGPAHQRPRGPMWRSRRSACRRPSRPARIVRPGGHVANVGVHGKPATLHLEGLWIKNLTITTGLVDTWSTPTLLNLVRSHQLDAKKFVTHRFPLDDILAAYDVFARAGDTGALKVALHK
jgi:alcohol dehydrogenase